MYEKINGKKQIIENIEKNKNKKFQEYPTDLEVPIINNTITTELINKTESYWNLDQVYYDLFSRKGIIKILFIVLIIAFFLFININDFIILENITGKENFTTKIKAFRKGKKYIDQCFQGQLITNQTFKKVEYPKVTMIIPVYNTGELIKPVLRSIQNQNMLEIEIILVNDYSNDNKTIKIIEELREEDPRIILINNNKNMGILYSRSIGVLQSKGEYIMNLDHDDLIFDYDVFDTAYKSAKNGNFDIISFRHVSSKEYNSSINEIKSGHSIIRHNKIVTQPELSVYALFTDEKVSYFDYTIWAKLYKSEIYKKATNLLTYERYSVFNIYNEDFVGVFIICNVAEYYKYIRKYGVFHRDYTASTSHNINFENKMFFDIFFSDVIIDLARNQFKKYSAIFLDQRVKPSNESNNKYLMEVIDKIMKCEYIEDSYKERIKNKFAELFLMK